MSSPGHIPPAPGTKHVFGKNSLKGVDELWPEFLGIQGDVARGGDGAGARGAQVKGPLCSEPR